MICNSELPRLHLRTCPEAGNAGEAQFSFVLQVKVYLEEGVRCLKKQNKTKHVGKASKWSPRRPSRSFIQGFHEPHCPGSFPSPPPWPLTPTLPLQPQVLLWAHVPLFPEGRAESNHHTGATLSPGALAPTKAMPHPIFLFPPSRETPGDRLAGRTQNLLRQRGLSGLTEEGMRLLRPKDYKTQVISACGLKTHTHHYLWSFWVNNFACWEIRTILIFFFPPAKSS